MTQKGKKMKKISDETARMAAKWIELLALITSTSAEEAQEMDDALADLGTLDVRMRPGRYERKALNG